MRKAIIGIVFILVWILLLSWRISSQDLIGAVLCFWAFKIGLIGGGALIVIGLLMMKWKPNTAKVVLLNGAIVLFSTILFSLFIFDLRTGLCLKIKL